MKTFKFVSTLVAFVQMSFYLNLAYGQHQGYQGELWFTNASNSVMHVDIGPLGEYRWGKDPSFSRTSLYTGTGGFTVPPPTPPQTAVTYSIEAVWENQVNGWQIAYDRYSISVDGQGLAIDYRTTNMISGTGDLIIRKEPDETYTWHNNSGGVDFLKEGQTVDFNGQEYKAWGDLWDMPLQTSGFDQSLSAPSVSITFYPVGGGGYTVPQINWQSDSFAKFDLERSFTGNDSWTRLLSSTTAESYIDYEVRIHPNPNMNTETVYYRVQAKLQQMIPNDDVISDVFTDWVTTNTQYWLLLKPLHGEPTSASDLPQTFSLLPNYPNPFTSLTHIPFDLFEESNISLTIYDLLARPIRTLHIGTLPAGHHLMDWDGKNDQGLLMSSGTYVFVIDNKGKRLVRSLNLVR